MDARIEMRKKDFKKTFDNPRRRREEQQVQIRKQNREARLTKKRQAALDELPLSTGVSTAAEQTEKGLVLTVKDIPEMARQVMADDYEQQFEGTQNFRKLLSIAKNPPIQEVINSGVTPRLVELLRDDTRPDVQFQAAWALTNIASGNQEQTQVVVQHGAVPVFVRLLSSPKLDVREQAIWALGNIAGDCPPCRDLVFQEGALQALLEQLTACLKQPNTAGAQIIKPTMLTNATWTLSNLCRGKPRPQLPWIAPAVPVLRELLYHDDPEVLTDTCWALSYLTEGSDFQSSAAIDLILNTGLAARLVQLLCHPSHLVQTPALRAVGNIVSGNDIQTQTMVVSGCVPALRTLLQSAKKTIVRKEACWTLSNITAGNKEQIQEVIKEGLISILVQLYPTAEHEIQKEIGWALANAASGSSTAQVQYLVEMKIIRPLCDCLDVKDDSSLVGAALEALNNILNVGKQLQQETGATENAYVVLVEEADAFPKLEQLQYAPVSSKEYKLAMQIMTTYLTYEEDVDEQEDAGPAAYEQFGHSNDQANAASGLAPSAGDGSTPFNFGGTSTGSENTTML